VFGFVFMAVRVCVRVLELFVNRICQ
jgi:hypothetical protein